MAKTYYSNKKMSEIKEWDTNALRRTKEYQEKRKEIIEERGGKCENKGCDSDIKLSIAHPQNYVYVTFSKNDGNFYSHYREIRYKWICPRCSFNRAFQIDEPYKQPQKVKHGKKFKYKYQCLKCGEKYKYPKRVTKDERNITTQLDTRRVMVGTDRDFIDEVKKINSEINSRNWKKYISFVDVRVLCQDCHFREHNDFLEIVKIDIINNNIGCFFQNENLFSM